MIAPLHKCRLALRRAKRSYSTWRKSISYHYYEFSDGPSDGWVRILFFSTASVWLTWGPHLSAYTPTRCWPTISYNRLHHMTSGSSIRVSHVTLTLRTRSLRIAIDTLRRTPIQHSSPGG